MPPKPIEYEQGRAHERYSAESERRKVAFAGAGYGALSGGLGLASTGAANARLAGTRAAQHSLKGAEAKLRRSGHPLAHQVGQVRRLGAAVNSTARRRRALSGSSAGLALASAGAGMAARFRQNEEAGISQGLGRIKAGERFQRDRQRVVASKMAGGIRTTAILADVNWDSPAVRRAAEFGQKHGTKIGVGTGATGIVGSTAYARRQGKRRLAARQDMRREMVGKAAEYGYREQRTKRTRQAELAAGTGLTAWGGSRLKMLPALVEYGVRQAGVNHGATAQAERAIDLARATRSAVRSGTGAGAAQLRRIKRVSAAVDAVPAPLRPAVATTVGVLMARNAKNNMHEERFTPVRGRPVYGW